MRYAPTRSAPHRTATLGDLLRGAVGDLPALAASSLTVLAAVGFARIGQRLHPAKRVVRVVGALHGLATPGSRGPGRRRGRRGQRSSARSMVIPAILALVVVGGVLAAELVGGYLLVADPFG